jgi:hypothetical protein
MRNVNGSRKETEKKTYFSILRCKAIDFDRYQHFEGTCCPYLQGNKCRRLFQDVGTNKLHGVTSHMTVIFVYILMRTSNLTKKYILFCPTRGNSVFWDITVSRPALKGSPSILPNRHGGLFPWGKMSGSEADHPPPFSANVKDEGRRKRQGGKERNGKEKKKERNSSNCS